MPGPAPTPNEIKRRRGSWRADLNPTEPQPDPRKPTCPAWMTSEAKACWREVCTQLHTMGVLTMVDRQVLAQYCEAWSLWLRCQRFVAERGVAFPVYQGAGEARVLVDMKPFPQVKMMRTMFDVLTRLGDRLGLNPSARTRMHARTPHAVPSGPGADDGGTIGKDRFFVRRTG